VTASAQVSAPPSAFRWIAAVSAADFSADATLPVGVLLTAGSTVPVIRNGVTMTLNVAGVYYVSPTSLGTVVGTAYVLYQ
jgi:hypothetical protein